MQFNQVNNNQGNVNNAISEKGNVVQTTGDQNKVQVAEPKEGFWTQAWKKFRSIWKWVTG